jgi:hypothetical protein
MNMMIGIISYLPNNELRAKRLQASRTQIEVLHKLFNEHKITIVAQNYADDDYLNDDNIIYRRYSEGIGAGAARNVLLEEFYKSDYDWLFILDDDTIFYPYYNYEDFIYEIESNPEKFRDVDAVSAVEPEYHPYKKLNYEDKANLTHYKFEPRDLNSGSATSILRNVKKYYDVEVYYPNTDASKGEGCEDIEFHLDWLLKGFNWYTLDTLIRKSLCFSQSSIFGTDAQARNDILAQDLAMIVGKYKDYGLRLNDRGKVVWKDFNIMHNKSHTVLYIPRYTIIEYDEHTTPKDKTTNLKLF